LEGWRKLKEWRRTLKNGCRSVGQAAKGGGRDKEKHIKQAVRNYLHAARRMSGKLHDSEGRLQSEISLAGMSKYLQLKDFLKLLDKHIDLLERRVLKGEKIPHEEKIFSIFERYTEWINKGKLYPSVELGKKVLITTDGNGLIVDYQVMENLSDSESVDELIKRMSLKYEKISSWSFDKGFYSKGNKDKLSKVVENPVLPKRGRLSQKEREEETCKVFKKFRNGHSAIESNINELEHCGLDRCPDRGYHHFKRYIAIGVTACNLKKIGKELLIQDKQSQYKKAA